MGLISKLISKALSKRYKADQEEDFGKYSFAVNSIEKANKLKIAENNFFHGQFQEAFKLFFEYLQRPSENNLEFSRQRSRLEFSFYQGSKLVTGYITDKEIHASSEIAQYSDFSERLAEILLKENNKLRYCKFTKGRKTISLALEAVPQFTPPSVLYEALKELAVTADSYDDILVQNFDFLKPINIQHIEVLPEDKLKVKLHYLRQWIDETLKKTASLSSTFQEKNRNKGIISYYLLSLTYKLYYLIAPEGVLLDDLKKIHIFFMSKKDMEVTKRNDYIITVFENIIKQRDDELAKSIYKVKTTFPVVESVPDEYIIRFIESELEASAWYRQNNNQEILPVIYQYIIGYLNFTVALPVVVKELFDIIWEIYNTEFFKDYGLNYNLARRDTLNTFTVENRINSIIGSGKDKFPIRTGRLNYSSKNYFAYTLLSEIANALNIWTKKD